MTRRFALVIGNSQYDDQTLSQLKTPDADVHTLAAALRDPLVGGFDAVEELINNTEFSGPPGDQRLLSAEEIRRPAPALLLRVTASWIPRAGCSLRSRIPSASCSPPPPSPPPLSPTIWTPAAPNGRSSSWTAATAALSPAALKATPRRSPNPPSKATASAGWCSPPPIPPRRPRRRPGHPAGIALALHPLPPGRADHGRGGQRSGRLDHPRRVVRLCLRPGDQRDPRADAAANGCTTSKATW